MDCMEALFTRRSIRRYLPKEVEREKIEKAGGTIEATESGNDGRN